MRRHSCLVTIFPIIFLLHHSHRSPSAQSEYFSLCFEKIPIISLVNNFHYCRRLCIFVSTGMRTPRVPKSTKKSDDDDGIKRLQIKRATVRHKMTNRKAI